MNKVWHYTRRFLLSIVSFSSSCNEPRFFGLIDPLIICVDKISEGRCYRIETQLLIQIKHVTLNLKAPSKLASISSVASSSSSSSSSSSRSFRLDVDVDDDDAAAALVEGPASFSSEP